MPRAKAGLGRTGSKHKKVSQFNIHREIKGVDDVFKQETPSNESPPESAKSASFLGVLFKPARPITLTFTQNTVEQATHRQERPLYAWCLH